MPGLVNKYNSRLWRDTKYHLLETPPRLFRAAKIRIFADKNPTNKQLTTFLQMELSYLYYFCARS